MRNILLALLAVAALSACQVHAAERNTNPDLAYCSSSDPKCDPFAFKREVDARMGRLDRPLAQPAPITKLYSNPGETVGAFARRATAEMELWSRRNGYASCGWIAEDGGRFGVIVMTVQRRASCSANQHPMEMELTPYLLTAKG